MVMERTGILTYNSGESRMTYESAESGTISRLLARCDDKQNEFSAATLFLKQRKLKNNQKITITYTNGEIGAAKVFCITDARPAA